MHKALTVSPQMVIGIFRGFLRRRTPNGIVIEKLPTLRNRQVWNGARTLAALLLKDPNYEGVLYHAIGEGNSDWDSSMPQASPVATTLELELYRKEPDGIYYVKYGDGSVVINDPPTILPGPMVEGEDFILDPYRVEGGGIIGRFEPDGWYDGLEFEVIAGDHAGTVKTVSAYYFADPISEEVVGRIEFDTPCSPALNNTDQYILGLDGEPYFMGTVPTNVIEIRSDFDFGVPPGDNEIREQGLFCGDATAVADSGWLFNAIHHWKIAKDADVALSQFIDIIFRT